MNLAPRQNIELAEICIDSVNALLAMHPKLNGGLSVYKPSLLTAVSELIELLGGILCELSSTCDDESEAESASDVFLCGDDLAERISDLLQSSKLAVRSYDSSESSAQGFVMLYSKAFDIAAEIGQVAEQGR